MTVKSINILEEKALVMQDVFDKVYPVGSVYMTFNDVNPATLFGGTWERVAKGRTLVGVDEEDLDFVQGKTGGEKNHMLTVNELPKHSFRMYSQGSIFNANEYYFAVTQNGKNTMGTIPIGGNLAHNNLQPYITCYIWQRLAR